MAGRRHVIFEFYKCTRCNRYRHRVIRGQKNSKRHGHRKKIWCPLCKMYTNMLKVY